MMSSTLSQRSVIPGIASFFGSSWFKICDSHWQIRFHSVGRNLYKECIIRYKDSFFFLDPATKERAKQVLHRLVEDQVEAQGANNNAAVQNTEDGNNAEGEDGSSILESLRKRICQGRERLREVRIVKLIDLYSANFTSG